MSVLLGTLAALSACGGSSTAPPLTVVSSPTSDGASETVPTFAGAEQGPPKKIVRIAARAGAAVALFPDGRAFFSPDGFNLAGGGSTVAAYSGTLQVIDVIAVRGGVDTLLSDGTVFFSPDGKNLGGGGTTVRAAVNGQKFSSLTQVGIGVDGILLTGEAAFYSPDGLNLDGGGQSIGIYSGARRLVQIVPVGPSDAVVTLFSDGSAFYSPTNREVGGGGHTVSALRGGGVPLKSLLPVGGGVLAQFDDGQVLLSPDGQNLGGGGRTITVAPWNATLANGPFQARDSASGVEFLGRLWLSGGFADPLNANNCFLTCSFYDLWSSADSQGASWNPSASFATVTSPDPRDDTPIAINGVQEEPVPTDFYEPYSPLVVWNGQLTAIGSTVWHSSDGVSWTRQNRADGSAAPGPIAPERAQEDSHAVVVGGVIFYIETDSAEVYRSADPHAALWSSLGAIPGYTPRCAAAVFGLDGKVFIAGGGACDYSRVFNDVWSSADGVNWTQTTKSAAWSERMWPCVATGADGIVWLAGGYAPTDWNNTAGIIVRYGSNHADVWYSKDGSDWRQFKADIGSGLPDDGALEARHAPTCYVAGATATTTNLVIVAGTGGIYQDDTNARVLNSIRALPLPPTATLP